MVDQIDQEEGMDTDMSDEADDTNVNGSDEKPFDLFNMIDYVKTSIQDFVDEEREEFEADVNDASQELYDTGWEVESDPLPPIQSIFIPRWSSEHPHPRPPELRQPRQSSRDQRNAEGSRGQRKIRGMSLLKRLISAPERGPRILKKKEQKGISTFDVVKGDDGPNVSLRYSNNTVIGNRHKWTMRAR
jgi:hypothetical protein